MIFSILHNLLSKFCIGILLQFSELTHSVAWEFRGIRIPWTGEPVRCGVKILPNFQLIVQLGTDLSILPNPTHKELPTGVPDTPVRAASGVIYKQA